MKKKNIPNKKVDYKDVAALKAFVDSYGRISSRRHSGITAKMARNISRAVKHARYMGLLPYISR